MAARGTRNMDAGEEKIEDESLALQLRAVSRRIHLRALITAIVIALAAFAFPQAKTWR
ncbi:MAG: hypothetical protein ACR2LC_07985 [Pyrinomonadaceae bacterium]